MTETDINDINFNYGESNSETFWVVCKHFESFVYAWWDNYEGTIQQPCQHVSAVALLHCCFVKKYVFICVKKLVPTDTIPVA